jgi:ornithine cyclodeaminase
MRFFSEAEVEAILDPVTLIAALERAFIDLSAGQVIQPLRSVMGFAAEGQPVASDADHGLLFMKPAQVGNALVTKLITLVPSNVTRGIPSLLATIVLMDPNSGKPVAIMEGACLTALRTAGASAVAAKALAPKSSRTLGILGSGVLARAHAQMLRLVHPIEAVKVWSPTRANAQACAAEIGGQACDSAEEVVRDADIVCTVTNAQTPVLLGRWLKPGAFVAAVGAPRPTWRELDDDAMANIIVADQREAAEKESGDVILSGASVYAEIGEILSGRIARPREGTTVVFKSLGLAIEDAVAAALVFQASQTHGELNATRQ